MTASSALKPDMRTTDIAEVDRWIREPDYSEEANLQWLVDWVNRRPLGAILRLRNNGWLPIETAPKDGRDILAISSTQNCWVVDWSRGEWRNAYGREPIRLLTHWQPLPTPPTTPARTEGE